MENFPYKISVITPCFNASKYLKEAIISVLRQDYPNFEHIIVDGKSTDGTLEIIKNYNHIIWISEPDDGQSDAMNKGFHMSSGEVIVYLNADDYFLPGAFKKVIPYFEKGAKFVVGNVKVDKEDGNYWIKVPKVTHEEMLRHWEKNAYCVNPVGYFYLREVQENVPAFNRKNHFAMDLEFLLESSLKYEFTKIPDKEPLGVFRYHQETKTAQTRITPSELYTFSNFVFINKFLSGKPVEFVTRYNRMREKAYRQLIGIHNKEKRNKIVRVRETLLRFSRTVYLKFKDFGRSSDKSKILRDFIRRNFTKP